MVQEKQNSVRILQSKPQNKKTPKISKAAVIGCLTTIIVFGVTAANFWYQPVSNSVIFSIDSMKQALLDQFDKEKELGNPLSHLHNTTNRKEE